MSRRAECDPTISPRQARTSGIGMLQGGARPALSGRYGPSAHAAPPVAAAGTNVADRFSTSATLVPRRWLLCGTKRPWPNLERSLHVISAGGSCADWSFIINQGASVTACAGSTTDKKTAYIDPLPPAYQGLGVVCRWRITL